MDRLTVPVVAAKLWVTSMPDTAMNQPSRSKFAPMSPTKGHSTLTKVFAATASEAAYVERILLPRPDCLSPNNTEMPASAAGHACGLPTLLGFRFAPRLCDLKDRCLFAVRVHKVPDTFTDMFSGTVNVDHRRTQWGDA
jgi:TnpA family transposase